MIARPVIVLEDVSIVEMLIALAELPALLDHPCGCAGAVQPWTLDGGELIGECCECGAVWTVER